MSGTKSYPVVTLRKGEERRLRQFHPWAYSNEIDMAGHAKAIAPGDLVVLAAADGARLGVATYNPHSLIAARMLSSDPTATIDSGFLASRLARALALREKLFDRPFYRLIHAEADGLPGLIVDRFDDALVLQANSAGMDRLTPLLIEALDATLKPKRILLKNDSSVRALEGLMLDIVTARGDFSQPLAVEENGANFLADPAGGQKTGWFYDQRDNRCMIAALARDARVLDLYCYAGGFAVQAARAGAKEVLGIDRSEGALALALRAAEANKVAKSCRFERGEVFESLDKMAREQRRFDIVIADPPAFVKNRKELKPGLQGYRKLTRMAAARVEAGGLLFIASCSHLADWPSFADAVRRGLVDARRGGRILRSTGAAADHPVHPALPESAYLKGLLLQLD